MKLLHIFYKLLHCNTLLSAVLLLHGVGVALFAGAVRQSSQSPGLLAPRC
jgi:hypothetical protein